MAYLVLLETSGNQHFIFATNKLRENIGASELTWRAGTKFVLEAVASSEVGGRYLFDEDTARFRHNLLDKRQNPSLDNQASPGVEVVVATSGKSILLVRGRKQARAIVHQVTRRALAEAPGIDIRGAVIPFKFDQTPLHGVIQQAYRKLEQLRNQVPGPEARFLRLPVVAPCRTSGLPAREVIGRGADQEDRSAVSLAKRSVAEAGWLRMTQVPTRRQQNLPETGQFRLAKSIDEIEQLETIDWLAVVHADGNGLGRVFLNFHEWIDAGATLREQNRRFVQQLRLFSLALDYCTEEAFRNALGSLHQRWWRGRGSAFLPVVPLVLGGDDLTVVCDGRLAVQFTCDYLKNFETLTRDPKVRQFENVVSDIIKKASAKIFTKETDFVSSAAGVAIVKPHFPFHAAYELAEELIVSAKGVSKQKARRLPCSAFDFHILHDASGADLERIRTHLTVDGGTSHLVARPYVIGKGMGAMPRQRQATTLEERITTLKARDNGRRRLPNHMLHELREGLFLGRETAQHRLELIHARYDADGLDKLLEQGKLFWEDDENGQWYTGLLDAMDLVEFWETEEDNRE